MEPQVDPTQQGGQNEIQNARLSAEEQIAARVHSANAPDFSGFNEETGEVHAKPQAEEKAEDKPEIEEEKPEVKEEPQPRTVSIVVDGQTVEVEESRILEAGKRALQKDHAADRRLQEAANAKRQAEELLRQAQRLSNPDASDDVPSKDAHTQQQEATSFTPEMLDTFLENKLYMRDAQKAAESFKKEFPEIAADPYLMNMAATLENQRLSTATALGESFGDPHDAYRKHGESIRSWLQKKTGTPSVESVDKVERKRTITAVTAVNAKAPAPQPQKPQSISEIIEEERKARAGRHVVKH